MMNDKLINMIIGEVKRALEERGIPVASGGKPSAGSIQPARPSLMKRPAQAAVQQKKTVSGGNDLTDRKVISQKDFEGLTAVSVMVRAKAVITPLAFDYAREKGITIERVAEKETASPSASASACGASPGTTAVALAFEPSFQGDRAELKSMLAEKGFAVNECTGQSYEAAVGTLSQMVVSGKAVFGICIENSGMAAPMYANRNKNVRAAHIRDAMEARAARVDYGANVIVLDAGTNPSFVIGAFCGME